MIPDARTDRLAVSEMADEVVLYDLDSYQVHRLNRTAGLVWKYCDGKHSVPQIADLLAADLQTPVSEEVVHLALDDLARAALLKEDPALPVTPPRYSRREAARLVGGLAALLPVVVSMVAPTAADASSGSKKGKKKGGGKHKIQPIKPLPKKPDAPGKKK
jgi:hypothetical protein